MEKIYFTVKLKLLTSRKLKMGRDTASHYTVMQIRMNILVSQCVKIKTNHLICCRKSKNGRGIIAYTKHCHILSCVPKAELEA